VSWISMRKWVTSFFRAKFWCFKRVISCWRQWISEVSWPIDYNKFLEYWSLQCWRDWSMYLLTLGVHFASPE
jgi:hypothetical protein